MKTIHCEVFTLENNGRRQDIILPMVKPMPDKMTENEAARFILAEAAEQVGTARLSIHKSTISPA